MSSGWIEKTLDEVCTKITDGAHRSPKSVNVGKPMSSVKDMDRFGLDLSSSRLISEEDFDSLVKEGCKPEVGDVLIAKDGNSALDTVCNVGEPIETVLLSSVAILRPNQELVDSVFLKYLLSAPENVEYLKRNFISGVAIPRVVLRDFKKAVFKFPELNVQKKISAHLGVLDAKIKLNTQLNQTLESMAQAMFKSWFIDFDPVTDNAIAAGNPIPEPFQARAERRTLRLHEPVPEGQSPLQPLPAELRQLFPNSFQETEELGWVPKGWMIEPLGNHLDVLETGRRPKGGVAAYKFGVPSIGAESIMGVANFDFGKTKYVPIEFFSSMRSGLVEDYDVLLYKDGGKPGEFKPRIGMYGEGFPFEEFAINEHVFRIRSKSLGQPFTYYQFSSERVFYELAVRGGKAAIPGINQSEVRSIAFLIPSESCLARFNEQVQTYFRKMLRNSGQSQVLSNIRDSLLPKLLLGQLRIPDAEAQIAEAGL